MNLIITIPKSAKEVRPHDVILLADEHGKLDGSDATVSETTFKPDGIDQFVVELRVTPRQRTRESGRRDVLTFEPEATVYVRPGLYPLTQALHTSIAEHLGFEFAVAGDPGFFSPAVFVVEDVGGRFGVTWNGVDLLGNRECERWREHSELLNRVSWRIAEHLGLTTDEQRYVGDIDDLVDRLIAAASAPAPVVDPAPTAAEAFPDHLLGSEGHVGTVQQIPVRANGSPSDLSDGVVLTAAGRCPQSGERPESCPLTHLHIVPTIDVGELADRGMPTDIVAEEL